MNKRLKTVIRLSAIIAIVVVLLLRGYREIVPTGAKSSAFLLASVDGGKIASPGGHEYRIYFNDAGAAHSGRHWTWVVDYSWFTGLYVTNAGYLDAEYAVDGERIPITWDGEDPVFPFADGRYD